MAKETRRISIGFDGGQVLTMRVDEEELRKLTDSLDGGGWLKIETEDGPVRVRLAQVVYVSADQSEPHVGFG